MLKKLIAATLLLITTQVWANAEQSKPTLTVYTYDSFASDWGPGPKIKEIFEQQCQCNLKFVALADGVSLLNRLRMEGKNSPADVVLGLDNNLLTAAKQSGLFAPHQQNVNTHSLTLPGGWQDDTFIPYDYGYFAFVYNQQTLKNPPKSLHELIESPEKWRVIYQDPRTSTPGQGLLLWIQKVYGDQAPQAWQQLAKKTVTVTKGWSDAYGLFLKGEADLVLSYTTSPAYHVIEEKDHRYVAAPFSEGHYLQVEIAGQLASSKQPKLAAEFMAFITTPAFQSQIPTTNWMYPVIDIPLPEAFIETPKPVTTLEFSPQEVAQSRRSWIQVWQNAVSR
ncbi:thiamine ABC transporter substrate binding subunit [Pragia fontium]|uniref:Thiamine-binding periplasmic protein n=1 Tax=Pragia fontium DSM 5563 = ATCC 49100 TaxID=1122977 RepID=A0AAJ5BFS6_9GAMM|nr:thiamine transport system substrate-binding protein [Pragia fontium DSM 5563 = ATCC 49100]SUB81606.1 Thiamine-binding periplasmic protein precursor [Pragia fontium]VEJ54053.1 Thiamine-binding periplasmic protein precursor [Pragia fontium]